MNSDNPLKLSPALARKLWHKCLMCLYLPIVVSGLTHWMLYPLLLVMALGWCYQVPALKAVIQDWQAAKWLLGFVAVSGLFLISWLYLSFEPARVLVSSAFVVTAVLFSRRIEQLAYKVWRGARVSYQV